MEPPILAPPSGNDKLWSILSHLSILLTPFIGIFLPLIVYLAMRQESAYLARNSGEALNFHLSLIIYYICCIPFLFILIGIPMMSLLGLVSLVLSIIAAFKASNGASYHYPLTIPFVRCA